MSNPHDYTVGWICAILTEYVAAQAFLDEKHEGPESISTNDNNDYTLGRIGKHNVAIAVLPHGEYGISSAASVARDMLHSFPNIRIGLMVGIGGGAPSLKHDIRLGDIIVSVSGNGKGGVFQFDYGKVKQDQEFQETGFLNQPPTILRAAVHGLMAQYESEGHQLEGSINSILEKKPRLRKKYKRPEPSTDRLYRPEVLHRPNDESNCAMVCGNDPSNLMLRAERTEDEDNPSIHYGLIASSNRVVKDALVRDALAKKGALCFEMEAAGLMNHFPCLVIRGICDYSDTHKNKDWQGYAAMAAAAYAKDLLYRLPPNKVENEKKISEVLSATSRKADTIIDLQQTQEHKDILDWITPVNYGPQQSDNIGRRQPGTGQWLLDSVQFHTWRDTCNQTLFCPGIPGAGKTILTSIVVDNLETLSMNDRIVGIAYVYCNFRRQDEQTARELLASLLKQLLQGLSTFPESVKSLHEKHSKKQSRPSLEEISSTLLSITKLYSRVFILIDALDECRTSDGSRTRLLEEVFELQAQSGINIFATSRPIPDVTSLFEDSISLEIRATDEDVRRFLRSHMSRLPAFVRRRSELEEEVTSRIVRSVRGMFLLAQLHLDSLLGKTTIQAVHDALAKLPSGSNAYYRAYETAMERIKNQVSDHRELAERILPWIICAKRPLSVEELRHALAVEVGSTELNKDALPETDIMVKVCVGLVTIDEEDGIIRLVHYTTQEYFEKTRVTWFPKAENNITTTCVTYLNFQIFKSGICPTVKEFEERLRMNPLYHYASQNWGFHAYNATPMCEGVIDFLESSPNVESASQALEPHFSVDVESQLKALHLAARFGLVGETRILLGANNPELTANHGQTPIFFAARYGHGAVVKLLLESGATGDLRDIYWKTPLLYTVHLGDEGTMQLMLEGGVDADLEDNLGQTPVSHASKNGRDDLVRLLLKEDVEVDSKDVVRRTPLSYAAEGVNPAVVQLLLENGAKVNSKDEEKRTPLSYAAKGGNPAVIQLLLENGAEVDLEDVGGRTPLSHTATMGHATAIQLLLKNGAKVDSKDTIRQTPLLHAATMGHTTVVQLLLKYRAKVDSEDVGRRTPLSHAAAMGHVTTTQILLENRAKVDSKDFSKRTPLLHAATMGHTAVVKLLLENRAKVDAEDNTRRTPLSHAAEGGYLAVVQLLLDNNAKADLEDRYGSSPLAYSVKYKHKEVFNLLLKYIV
ncbi:related to ankyrin [Fusarium oxysporum]|uniref:Related to ankyrin n=1 Tax=Fusarium oxysporum TaxID=5507 RepID=A0A2H3U7G7_FUSOX|nr:related to ankyrin [Fusarium oxysporum]